jgi:hypothetical protein
MSYSVNENSDIQRSRHVNLCATEGLVNIDSLGEKGVVGVNASSINLNARGSFLNLNQSESGGGISLSTNGEGSSILLSTPTSGNNAMLTLTPGGFLLAFGPSAALGTVQIQEGEMALSMGPPGLGSLLTLTPESITLKVGLATLTLTAEGLSTSVGSTTVEVGPTGVSEAAGAVTRELGPAGHTLEAGESTLEVVMSGLAASGPTGSLAFDASSQVSGAMATESADGVLNLQGPMVNAGA